MELIIQIGGAAVAVSTIAGLLYKIIKFFVNLEQHSREIYMSTLKLIVVSSDMPINERLAAGEKYIQKGGNGEIKALYEALKKKRMKELY